MNDLVENERLEFKKLRAAKILIEQATQIFIPGNEAKKGYIFRDGQMYLIQGSEHTLLTQLAHKKELHQE